MYVLRWWFVVRLVTVSNAIRCASLPYKHYGTHGYCYFWLPGLPTATYDQSVAACRQAYDGAELASFPDETLLPLVLDSLELQESLACCKWVRLNVIRVSDVGNTHDNWKWILPDGSQLELPATTIAAQVAPMLPNEPMTDFYRPITNLLFSTGTHVFTSQLPSSPHHYTCQIRSSTFKWAAKAGHESNSSVISQVEGVRGPMNCAEKCVRSDVCLSFTFLDSNGGICRIHSNTIGGLLLTGNEYARIYSMIA